MKSEKVSINGAGDGIKYALLITEGIGEECLLEKKQILQLRLLAEELFGMIQNLAGDIKANYWIEYDERQFGIHMKADLELTEDLRKQFLSISSTGENAATKSFMGKIRVMIAETLFLTQPADTNSFSGLSMEITDVAALGAGGMSYLWSLDKYKDEAKKQADDNEDASEAWDELEKSIVAKIADEVSVKIVGSSVEIIVNKKF